MYAYLSASLMDVNSAALPHGNSAALLNPYMRTVDEVRRLRLQELRDDAGSLAALNERLQLSRNDSTLSQYANLSPGSKTSKPKAMGSSMARRLEAAFNKETGWMDTDPDCHAWPFGDRVDYSQIRGLPSDAIAEAVGALNEVLRRAGAFEKRRAANE